VTGGTVGHLHPRKRLAAVAAAVRRMDSLKQLGCANLRFPGAAHISACFAAAAAAAAAVRRMDSLKQLGCANWAFPGAFHTRRQHSLGVAHLAVECGLQLHRNGATDVTPEDLMLLGVAGEHCSQNS
jgi:HD superfamily phosphohydrolase